MTKIESLSADPRVTVRRQGAPDPDGRCVVYWMQRAQRALDNPALDLAVEVANLLASADCHLLRAGTVLSSTPTCVITHFSRKVFPTSPSVPASEASDSFCAAIRNIRF